MPLIGIESVYTAGEALEAINSPNVDLIAIGRETYKEAIKNYQQVKNIYIDTSDALKGLY
ncbi:hypothetical protein BUZ11_01865 [Staphylococcus gallinarum]|jgi:2,4-dienoyl-CoA reductase-like NADH-dependent reductase (Old Yellow Enzyme family)|nr:hypothetical protein [Staphylococcus gallinarum]MCD8785787.1 hypothetical protein [Staphylococcus gallinarum]MCD8793584.1 hypothetical protein [Staphylococcus gallinarum]MCD8820741.1 hypothetical protein [Staphylococcus gallinarum]MCD8858496.1 hypothetical protein [Staphylococcus gallinarum]